MDKFTLILKNVFAGLAIIAIIFTICFFIVQKFYSGHPHGMSGLLTVLTGFLTAGIFTITSVILVFRGKEDFKSALKLATGLGLGFGIAITIFEIY